jgi:predicted amidohydrolase
MQQTDLIKAGFVQFDIRNGDIPSNKKTVRESIERLAGQGADICLLPELWSCGFDPSAMKNFAQKTPGILEELSKTALQYRMMIAGSMPELHREHLYNTLFLLNGNGEIAGTYRKIHLFPPLKENACFTSGEAPIVCRTAIGPIGLMICYDLRFPELCRSLALQGARIVLVSAQWPEARIDHWDLLLRARAIENQVFIVACNRVGRDGDLIFNGHSQIISPWGNVLTILKNSGGEDLAELRMSELLSARESFDCLTDRVPDAYHL